MTAPPMTDPSTPPDPSDPSSFSTGPCLDVGTVTSCLAPMTGSFIEPSTGPCLSIDPTDTSSSSGGSDSDSDTDTDTDTDTGTSGESGTDTDPPDTQGALPSRDDTVRRLVDAGILPADLADRLARSAPRRPHQ
jgi:hypothetical protein